MANSSSEKIAIALITALASIAGAFITAHYQAKSTAEDATQDILKKHAASIQDLQIKSEQLQHQVENTRQVAERVTRLGEQRSGASIAPGKNSLPSYTQDVLNFEKSQIVSPYVWDGYKHDVSELNNLAQGFLQYLVLHPDTTYSQARSFYEEIDRATSIVGIRAEKNIRLKEDEGGDAQNYNWHVYAVPSLFRVHIEDLRNEHQNGQGGMIPSSGLQADKDTFEKWRKEVGF